MKKSTFAITIFALLCLNTRAQTNYTENFESGNMSNWTLLTANMYVSTFTNKVPTGGVYAAKMTNSLDGVSANLPAGLGLTSESFRFTYYFYNESQTRGGCEVRSYTGGSFTNGSAQQVIFVGQNNNISPPLDPTEVYNGSKYQGRIAFGTPFGYFNLNGPGSPNRSVGWHRFDVERGTNTASQVVYDFYVDNILSRRITNSSAVKWDSIVMGFPRAGTIAGNAYYDGLEVIQGETYIAGQPVNTTNSMGQDATLTVYAYGQAGALSYQWKKGASVLAGATDSSYTIPNSQPSHSGSYSVVVSNALAVKTSDAAYLQVNPLNFVTVPPTNQIVNVGSNVTFYAEGTGGGTVYYQWKFYGTNIPGATGSGASSTYDITGVTLAQAGPYSVTVTNSLNDPPTTSAAATLLVNNFPLLTAPGFTNKVGQALDLVLPAADDYSPQTVAFQMFETNAAGRHTMFAYPSGSGSTDPFVENPGISAVTSGFPGAHGGGSNVLEVAWNWTNATAPAGWLRLTTASSAGAQDMVNPIIYITGPLRFDMWCSKDLLVGAGVRETNPTGAIGSDAGGSSAGIEFIGVSAPGSVPAPALTNTVAASNWVTVELSLPDVGVGSYNLGNGLLDFTTGKQTLEQLTLAPADGNPGEYLMYLDNFVSVPSNAMTFELVSGPAGASVDKYTGRVQWTPNALADAGFTVKVTDAWGLPNTASFTVKVVDVAVPGDITIAATGSNVTLNWTNSFQLQSNSVSITNPTNWFDVPGITTSPYLTPAGSAAVFYRLRK
ncbi:MAG: hypothetical protein EXS35_09690 [Pedosphaera sp.]|nr:hypothetical protein [Pedosphaera sp.]